MRHVSSGRLSSSLAIATLVGPLLLGAGCGLLNSDLTTVMFDLPERTYAFDTSQSQWNGGTSSTFSTVPTIPCAATTDCCPLAVSAAGIDCAMLICDAPTQSCAFTVLVQTPAQMVNLKNEVPALSGYSSQSVVDISVSRIAYDVVQNTLNVDLPMVDLFVGPATATVTTDPGVIKFGTVPVIPRMTTLTDGEVILDPAGKAAFENIAKNFGTPFVFLSSAQVVVPGGTPAPTGALTITIKGRLSAKPNL
jgi:hypothetical protein